MMEAPLRAFLMMRSDDAKWTVTVCRDLGAVVHTWKARQEPDRDVAVLHVGFDRPPSHIFDEIAVAHPGHMLLTAAAKHALPISFVTSAAPVALLETTEVFVGLLGWGYCLDDPTQQGDRSDQTQSNVTTQEPKGWVALFLEENPSTAEALLAQAIHDDASYLKGESNLESSVRHRLGMFRTHYMIGDSFDDPCALARAAPPWLVNRDLSTLGLTVRVKNVFDASEIMTLQDLGAQSPEALMELQNFGRKSLQDTLQTLSAALNEGPPRSQAIDSVAESNRLLMEVRRSLLTFPDRERDILVRRLGFETTPETLQDIADFYGVTRERIRQIEVHTTKKWVLESYWDDILEQKITRLLIGRSFPLPVAGVEAIDPWFEGVSSHLVFFRNLVHAVCKRRIHFIDIGGLCYFSMIKQEMWQRTVNEAEVLLSSGVGHQWSEDYARSLVHGLLPDTAKEFGPILWDKASQLCHFTDDSDGSRILTSYGRGAEQLIKAILAESDTPLHYSEIAKCAEQREGQDLDPRRAHCAAANVGFLFARGTFGLAQHIPISDEHMVHICTEAEDVVTSEAPEKQWHTSEILSELLERLDDGFDLLDKYVLDIALTKSTILKPLGKMTWTADGDDSDEHNRVDIHQAIIAIVTAAGRPLSTSEIKERLTAVRGVNNLFQISMIDPLIRVQPGVWGLSNRDVPLSHEELRDLIEALVSELEAKQSGIHASELCSTLPLHDCPPDAFLSIAIQDKRLSIAQGRYVYLSEWDDPRRETVRQAVSVIIENANEPLALEHIATLVECRISRKCEKPTIYNALRALEAEYDTKAKGWSMSRSEFIEEDNGAEA